SVAMLTMVMSMLIMGVNWSIVLLILSGVLTAVTTVFYSFQSARCMCGTNQYNKQSNKAISDATCDCPK
ncbi:MAG: hypothetical protein WBV92_05735, partial [Nitrosotalea sp.]